MKTTARIKKQQNFKCRFDSLLIYGAPFVPQKKIIIIIKKKKRHRHLAVKFGTTPKIFLP
jgi:hypothetical protein